MSEPNLVSLERNTAKLISRLVSFKASYSIYDGLTDSLKRINVCDKHFWGVALSYRAALEFHRDQAQALRAEIDELLSLSSRIKETKLNAEEVKRLEAQIAFLDVALATLQEELDNQLIDKLDNLLKSIPRIPTEHPH